MRNIAWKALVYQALFLLAIIIVFNILGIEKALLFATFLYLAILIFTQTFLLKDYRKAIQAIHKKDFGKAISHFEKGLKLFQKYPWLDKYRYILLLSPLKISYTELAKNNIIYCENQLKNQ